ncbi:MAG: SRPBCC family protein [Candidatus Dormibacteraeota bacterium]|nr:SRPBCC family protein [Candidatus Dormibacteraeota bacterium]MBO0759681.1 SRPBCC family protein [Candidatus Dormibacteraeota bacterium]
MQIENSFEIAAAPDEVYRFLLDVNRVAACMPGAELSEVVDPDTFKGKVRIKVGPITVAYNGTARITERDEAARRAVLSADGRETTGPGSARASATMTVEEADAGSRVLLATDFTVAGRVANFGRGVMEDVSRRLVGQMADCIKSSFESQTQTETETPAIGEGGGAAGGPQGSSASAGEGSEATGQAASSTAGPATGSTQDTPAVTPSRPQASPPEPKPVNAVSLFFAVVWDRIKRLFGGR